MNFKKNSIVSIVTGIEVNVTYDVGIITGMITITPVSASDVELLKSFFPFNFMSYGGKPYTDSRVEIGIHHRLYANALKATKE